MKPSFSDWEAEQVLQALEHKQRAEKMLAKPAGPWAFVLIFVVGAATFRRRHGAHGARRFHSEG